jgi:rSAM/selenodomain-associated transferase 1
VQNLLLVFLKAPRTGTVKTRLLPALGPEMATELYRALAEAEVQATAPDPGAYARLFCYTPEDARGEIEAWFPGEALWPQPFGDLGARMAAAFAEGFRRGARRVAIIGTDVPWVSRETVGAAFSALETYDVAVGPSRDGGYYLLALRDSRPTLFAGVAWSTPTVLETTLARADSAGLTVRTLEPMTDLDTLEDLRAEWFRLEPLLAARPALARAVARALGA